MYLKLAIAAALVLMVFWAIVFIMESLVVPSRPSYGTSCPGLSLWYSCVKVVGGGRTPYPSHTKTIDAQRTSSKTNSLILLLKGDKR